MNDLQIDAFEARLLRDMARQNLDEAARCPDPARRDVLLHQAVALLAEARRLRDPADAQATPRANRDDPLNLQRTEQP